MTKEVTWSASVGLFSGRPDPIWQLTPDVATRFLALWDALEPLRTTVPAAPPLGYRGCFVSNGAGQRWAIFNGAASLTGPRGDENRGDIGRALERFIISSAPPGRLPERIDDMAGLGR